MSKQAQQKYFYLALGSNQGNRLDFLRQAVAHLAAHSEIEIIRKSRIYETESVEDGGDDEFLNAVIYVATSLSAAELLNAAQNIEQSLGRPAPPRTGSRCIDIDLLFCEQTPTPRSAQLQIPHPRMHRRSFVLAPLLDVLNDGTVRLTPLNW